VTGGAPAIVAGNFTYSNCNNSCVVTEENGPAEIKVLKEGHETSKVTGEGLFHVECGTFIDCLYTGEGLVGTGKGPLLAATEKTNGEVKFSNQKLNEEGGSFFCPDTSELTITTTPLEATYIVGGLHYCVKYEHGGNGHYADEHCTERGNLQTEPYELVVVTNGVLYSVGEVLCVDKYQKNGLWKEVSNGNICKEDGTLGAELYEKGLIKLVK
jgi:hypothetical protein